MRFTHLLAGLLLPFIAGQTLAQAATVTKYDESAFNTAQQQNEPILLFIEASWCPTCARERPILKQLYGQPDFKNLRVFDIDFDTSKPLLRHLGVQFQSTLIVYHGAKETGRLTGATDPQVIENLLETSKT